jgi:hypothetical protein
MPGGTNAQIFRNGIGSIFAAPPGRATSHQPLPPGTALHARAGSKIPCADTLRDRRHRRRDGRSKDARQLTSLDLHQLDPVAEGVVDEESVETFERLVIGERIAPPLPRCTVNVAVGSIRDIVAAIRGGRIGIALVSLGASS